MNEQTAKRLLITVAGYPKPGTGKLCRDCPYQVDEETCEFRSQLVLHLAGNETCDTRENLEAHLPSYTTLYAKAVAKAEALLARYT